MDGRLQLIDFIARTKAQQVDVARAAKMSPSHLSLFIDGKRALSVPTSKRLSDATGGQVPWPALAEAERADR